MIILLPPAPLTVFLEEVPAVFAGLGDAVGDGTAELYDVSQVVLQCNAAGSKTKYKTNLVSRVVVPRVRLEQVVPRGELKRHAGRGPDVRRGAVSSC